MNNDKIGVIVPVYKTEKFIAECIESILAQTYTNFRLILVDDGTPDNAGKICDEYAKKDNRITVIHQENAGVTRARAAGVEEASDCEWITFVDSDDTLPKTALDELLNALEEDISIVVTDSVVDFFPRINEDKITAHIYKEYLIGEKISSAPWGKLFKKDLFNELTFDLPREVIMGEDLVMNLRLADNYKKNVVITHICTYNYNRHNDNICHNFKETAEHELILYLCLSPLMDIHSQCLIRRFLSKWNRLFGYSYKKPAWYGTEFHKVLISDIAKYRYNISHLDNILLKTANPIVRFITINLKKVINRIIH